MCVRFFAGDCRQCCWCYCKAVGVLALQLVFCPCLTVVLSSLKDKSKVTGDFFKRFPLKLAENGDVGETVI